MEAEPFPQPPLDAIAVNRMPETLLNNQPQAMVGKPVVSIIQPEMGRFQAYAALLHPQEIR